MTKVTQAHVEARTASILEAAEKVFAEKGFAGATMADVAREAGISAGAIYRYFPSKEALIEALSREQRERNEAIAESVRAAGSTGEVLTGLAEKFFRPLEKPEAFLEQCVEFELTSEARRNPQIRETRARDYQVLIQSFTAVIRGGQAEGVINPEVDAVSVARLMIASFEGLTMQLAVDESIDVRAYANALQAMMSGHFWTGGKGHTS